ncbi:MAG: 50S ribosomal protein L6 [Bacteroidetes bacterium HGW-Bacteroidetes-21]|jgi:large subunit ribosomal protein L6|nr:MAG: 50S ribosomal protein L6 [Bacteroidetes bacterium HGW-Bacteroidetes-21]
MSRIGKLPINVPAGVTITVSKENVVTVKGPLGELKQQLHPDIQVNQENDTLLVTRPNDEKQIRAMHGLYRSLVNNMVIGVSTGFTIKQEVVGVGYKAEAVGQELTMSLGFSHEILFEIPAEVKVEAKTEKRANPIITLTSNDKQLIGQVAAKIRSLRKPEPYKGKGIKFVNEVLRKKAGKSASAK